MCYFCTKRSYEDLLSLISNTYFFSQNLFTACQTSALLLNGISTLQIPSEPSIGKITLIKFQRELEIKNLSVGV